MFAKDALMGGKRLDQEVILGDRRGDDASTYRDGEQVVLLDCVIVTDEFPLQDGTHATKSNLLIAKLDGSGTTIQGEPIEVGTLSRPIAEKVRLKGDGSELPAIVTFFWTDASQESFNAALVMQGVRRYDGPVPEFKPLEEGVPF